MTIIFISRFLINLPTSLCTYISFQLHLYWIILCLWLKYLHIKDRNLLYHQEDMCLDSAACIVVITIHWPVFRLYSLSPHIIYFWFSLHVEYSIQMSLLFPLSYGCDDQNIMSITTKRHRGNNASNWTGGLTSFHRTSGWSLFVAAATDWRSCSVESHFILQPAVRETPMMWWQLMGCGNVHSALMFGQHESFTAYWTFVLPSSFIIIKTFLCFQTTKQS